MEGRHSSMASAESTTAETHFSKLHRKHQHQLLHTWILRAGPQVQEMRGQGSAQHMGLGTPRVWRRPGRTRVHGGRGHVARGRAQNCPQKPCLQSASAAFCVVLGQDDGPPSLQETMGRRNGHDLGTWEVSLLDAREGGGTQVSCQEDD